LGAIDTYGNGSTWVDPPADGITKRRRAMAVRRPKPAVKDVTHFFLIKHTAKGTVQSAAQKKKGVDEVTKVVRKEGGQCQLYSTRGAIFDYVSVMTGLSTAAAVRIAAEIEKRGTVNATLLSGIMTFDSREPRRGVSRRGAPR
jgi:uncharacterized protein with GYD domain